MNQNSDLKLNIAVKQLINDLNNLKNNAKIGIESEKTIELPNSSP